MSDAALFTPALPPIPANSVSFTGFLRAVRTNALGMWPASAYQQDTLEERMLGRSRFLLNAPEAIHRVLVENTVNYRRTRASLRILRPITGNGLLLSEGEDWRHQRRTIAPTLAPRIIPVLCRHIAAAADAGVLQLSAKAGQPVDLLAAMQFLALEVAGRSMVSMQMDGYGAEMRALLLRFAMRHAQPDLLDILLPAGIPSLRDFGRRRFQRLWMGLMDRIGSARLETTHADLKDEPPRDLFDALVAARDPETGAQFSRDMLRDQTATMILAGHETTATTLFWSLALLAEVPAEQDLVAAEVSGLDLSPNGAAENLKLLVRTRAVVSEALRLYPPAFVIVREAIGADTCGDVAVPAGSVVMISPWVLHRHHRLWPSPDSFDPRRFLPGAAPPRRFAYLPFGAGPRICVGAQFAMAEATLVLARMIQAFHVQRAGRRPIVPVAVVTTQPDHAPEFILQTR
jgi:cytochrome P450